MQPHQHNDPHLRGNRLRSGANPVPPLEGANYPRAMERVFDSLAVTATRRVAGWLSPLGLSPLALDDALASVTPLWRVHHLQARLVSRQAETPSASTLVLQVGPAFPRLKPGQYVVVGVEIQGVCHRRAYSPRAVPGRRDQIAITVQRQPGGRVSGHLVDELPVGSWLEIAPPAGEFVLPAPRPRQVLLIAGGSGITPCMAMLQHLHQTAPDTLVTLVYFARSAVDRIFAKDLQGLARVWRQLHYVPVDSLAHTPSQAHHPTPQADRVLSLALLDAACRDWRHTEAYCCGPAPLMDTARTLWRDHAPEGELHLEAFAAPRASGDPQARHQIRLQRGREHIDFTAAGHHTLLVAGEAAGHHIKHGCRQGICHECTCRLRQGSVQDLVSGERIDGEGQPIRLCVSSAMSDVELESLN